MDREEQLMNEDSKKALQQCLPVLCNEMRTTELLTWMESKNAFTHVDVQGIEAKPTQYRENKEFITLLKGKNQKAFDTFIECLWETGQQHLATEVLNNLNDRKYVAEILKSCQPQSSKANKAQGQHIKKIQEALKEMYLQRFKKIRPFSLPFTFDIEKTWVSLALRKDHLQSTEDRLQATEDHVELLKSAFSKAKMLIIEGKPATGKTSLMRKLAYDWSTSSKGWLRWIWEQLTGKELSLYDLVVYAQFRDVREQIFESIADLVIEYNKKYMEKDDLEILSALLHDKKYIKQKRVLVLIDGYDESSLHEQCTELTEYLTATTIKEELLFNIVVTTRPGYLGQHRGYGGRYTFADVLGFTTIKQKDKYIFNHFKSSSMDSTKQITAVRQLLENNENINTLAETPLFLTFICLVYERIVDGTVLELYCNIIWWLIDRHQKDFPDRNIPLLFEFQDSSDKNKFEIIQDHYHQFSQLHCLGKMGMYNLNKDVFDESDCKNFSLKEILQQVGLLRKEKFHDERFRLTTSYSFPHRTIQEFLAALYFFCSKEELNLSTHEEVAPNSKLDTDKMTQYQSFLLQIALSDGLGSLQEKCKIYFESLTEIDIYFTFYYAFNTINGFNSKLLNAFFAQCKNARSICVKGLDPQRSDASSLYFNNLLHLHTVTFHRCHFKTNYQLCFKNCPALKHVKFDHCPLQSSNMDFAEISAIDRLEFFNCTFEADSQLSVKNCAALKNMAFSNGEIRRGYTMNIDTLTEIDTLEFSRCNIDFEAWQIITEEIRKISVKCLILSFTGTHFKNEYINRLQKCNNVIKEMEIYDYTIRSNDHLSFNNLINLHSLTLWKCSFEANSQLSFKDCRAIDTLKFHGCNIDSEFWISIIEEIRNSTAICLKFSPDMSKYLNSLQECNEIAEIYIANMHEHQLEKYEKDIVQQLIKLAQNIQSLKRIVFDFTIRRGELKEDYKELIVKAGQERDPNFTVSIIPYDK